MSKNIEGSLEQSRRSSVMEIVVSEEDAYECSPNNMATDNAQERIEMKIDKMLSRLDEVEANLSTRLNSLTDQVPQVENKMANVEDLSQSTRDQLDGVKGNLLSKKTLSSNERA